MALSEKLMGEVAADQMVTDAKAYVDGSVEPLTKALSVDHAQGLRCYVQEADKPTVMDVANGVVIATGERCYVVASKKFYSATVAAGGAITWTEIDPLWSSESGSGTGTTAVTRILDDTAWSDLWVSLKNDRDYATGQYPVSIILNGTGTVELGSAFALPQGQSLVITGVMDKTASALTFIGHGEYNMTSLSVTTAPRITDQLAVKVTVGSSGAAASSFWRADDYGSVYSIMDDMSYLTDDILFWVKTRLVEVPNSDPARFAGSYSQEGIVDTTVTIGGVTFTANNKDFHFFVTAAPIPAADTVQLGGTLTVGGYGTYVVYGTWELGTSTINWSLTPAYGKTVPADTSVKTLAVAVASTGPTDSTMAIWVSKPSSFSQYPTAGNSTTIRYRYLGQGRIAVTDVGVSVQGDGTTPAVGSSISLGWYVSYGVFQAMLEALFPGENWSYTTFTSVNPLVTREIADKGPVMGSPGNTVLVMTDGDQLATSPVGRGWYLASEVKWVLAVPEGGWDFGDYHPGLITLDVSAWLKQKGYTFL